LREEAKSTPLEQPQLADLAPEGLASDSMRPWPHLERPIFLVGSAGLLLAMAVDSLAVLGRHAGFVVAGSIELVQCAIVVIASAAMVLATVSGAHATVHIITSRLSDSAAARWARFADAASACVFLLLAAGSIWIATELWDTGERTEILGVSMRWLRLIWIASSLLIAGLFFDFALRRRPG
jgi:TRAP-type C4-dicarboxylate transport system permease small subunit